jgi:hypothetical protein
VLIDDAQRLICVLTFIFVLVFMLPSIYALLLILASTILSLLLLCAGKQRMLGFQALPEAAEEAP